MSKADARIMTRTARPGFAAHVASAIVEDPGDELYGPRSGDLPSDPMPTTRHRRITMKHTPEPWRLSSTGRTITQAAHLGEAIGRMVWADRIPQHKKSDVRERGKANGERIVACVNACAGLNPEGIKEVLGAFRSFLGWFEDNMGNEEWLRNTEPGDPADGRWVPYTELPEYEAALAALEKVRGNDEPAL